MQRLTVLILMLTLMLMLNACGKKEKTSIPLTQVDLAEEENMTQAESVVNSIFVYVYGAVQTEGVYELPSGSRVYEAIEKAGGFREDAETRSVNQAMILSDEDCIYIPAIGEEGETSLQNDGKVNLNKASKEELMTLPGIGQSKAESIIRYRENNGGFQKIEDIMKISGIKESLFEQIKDLIKV